MPATQRKCIYRDLTLDVNRHYIGSVTATKPAPHGITSSARQREQVWQKCKIQKNSCTVTMSLTIEQATVDIHGPLHSRCETGVLDESASPAWLASPAMNFLRNKKLTNTISNTKLNVMVERLCSSSISNQTIYVIFYILLDVISKAILFALIKLTVTGSVSNFFWNIKIPIWIKDFTSVSCIIK